MIEIPLSVHRSLVDIWNTEGPDYVHELLTDMPHDTVVELLMLHTGKAALLSAK